MMEFKVYVGDVKVDPEKLKCFPISWRFSDHIIGMIDEAEIRDGNMFARITITDNNVRKMIQINKNSVGMSISFNRFTTMGNIVKDEVVKVGMLPKENIPCDDDGV